MVRRDIASLRVGMSPVPLGFPPSPILMDSLKGVTAGSRSLPTSTPARAAPIITAILMKTPTARLEAISITMLIGFSGPPDCITPRTLSAISPTMGAS